MKQVIVVKLDGIYYGIDVGIVQEVVYSYAERSLPEAPNFIEGLAYVREQLLPIVRTKRLFDSAFFDLYGNKKVLVLSFARMKGQSASVDISSSSVGIVIDDVVGIESYEEADVMTVPSVYGTNISHEISGFLKKRDIEIALLNIANFFLDNEGNFKYQKYVHKNNDTDNYVITREDMVATEEAIQGFFPLTGLTRKPIFTYLSRFAGFEKVTIKGLLKGNPKFFGENIHSRKKTGREPFFSNAPDMYVILEYLSTHLKSGSSMNALVIDTKGSSSTESLVLAIDSVHNKGKTKFNIEQLITDGTKEDISFVYPKNMLEKITGEMIEKYFEKTDNNLYKLKEVFSSKIHFHSGDLENLGEKRGFFDLIYAPNFLVQKMDRLEHYVKLLEKITQKDGILVLGLFEDIEDFAKSFKKYYIKSRLVFVKG